ncbi:hypothetical protein EVAR_44396_1 [Eumeta japonica]|uniref:Uncharacterized protein n=1 Tax=Eumeta variegata TaxID=151549 RepID=A0A4C1XPK2_EUMVA|nr:hypothetical protein EVAR_44396_1 [Eumeta japonica]
MCVTKFKIIPAVDCLKRQINLTESSLIIGGYEPKAPLRNGANKAVRIFTKRLSPRRAKSALHATRAGYARLPPARPGAPLVFGGARDAPTTYMNTEGPQPAPMERRSSRRKALRRFLAEGAPGPPLYSHNEALVYFQSFCEFSSP